MLLTVILLIVLLAIGFDVSIFLAVAGKIAACVLLYRLLFPKRNQ